MRSRDIGVWFGNSGSLWLLQVHPEAPETKRDNYKLNVPTTQISTTLHKKRIQKFYLPCRFSLTSIGASV